VPEYIRNDFKQELFIILLGKDHSLIIELHDNKQLVRYIARIIINLMRQSKNVFHRTYNKGVVELNTETLGYCEHPDELQIRKFKEDSEDNVLQRIEGLDEELGTCYYRLLASAYKKHGSMREVSRQTGIPVMSISDSFKKLRKHLST